MATLAACGTPGTSTAPSGKSTTLPPLPATPPASGAAATVALPLDAYQPSVTDQSKLQLAVHNLASRCAARQGFTLPQPTQLSNTMSALAIPGSGQGYNFGLTSMSWAERYGYHHSTPVVGPAGKGGILQQKPAMSPAEQQVNEACVTEVYRETGIPSSPQWYFAESLAIQTYTQSLSDPRVLGVFAAWSLCMKAKGYNYATPMKAEEGIPENGSQSGAGQWATPAPTPEEIQTAVADVACKQQANVVALWSSVLAAYQNTAISKDIVRLEAGIADFNAALGKAEALLGRQG
jgi:hypothetical protein